MPRHATSTSFKKGQIAHNKQPKLHFNCRICNKEIIKLASYVRYWFKKRGITEFCCSKSCAARKKELAGLSLKALELANSGKSVKEIALILNKSNSTISSWLNRKKFRRYSNGGQSYAAQVKRLKNLYNKCEICEFARCIEIAHILPASKGGDLNFNNVLGLCPNHHYLFDAKKLTGEEAEKISYKVLNWSERIG